MKWWKKALIISGIWFVWDFGIAILHTEVILSKVITPELDELLTGQYTQMLIYGFLFICLFSYHLFKNETIKKYQVTGIVLVLWGICIAIYGISTDLPVVMKIPTGVPVIALVTSGVLSILKSHKLKTEPDPSES